MSKELKIEDILEDIGITSFIHNGEEWFNIGTKVDGSKPTITILEEVDGPDFRRDFIKLMECFKQVDESKIYRPPLVLEYVYGTE